MGAKGKETRFEEVGEYNEVFLPLLLPGYYFVNNKTRILPGLDLRSANEDLVEVIPSSSSFVIISECVHGSCSNKEKGALCVSLPPDQHCLVRPFPSSSVDFLMHEYALIQSMPSPSILLCFSYSSRWLCTGVQLLSWETPFTDR